MEKGKRGKRWTDLLAWSVQQPHRVGGASSDGIRAITGRVRAIESANAVKAEAVGAVVGAVEDGRRRVTSHRFACPLQPTAVLGALALKRAPKEKRSNSDQKKCQNHLFLFTTKSVSGDQISLHQ